MVAEAIIITIDLLAYQAGRYQCIQIKDTVRFCIANFIWYLNNRWANFVAGLSRSVGSEWNTLFNFRTSSAFSRFFIAALAAVATFDRPQMDKPLRGEPALLSVWDNNLQKKVEKILTRRQFVCYLFGYLSFVSLILYLMILVLKAIHPTWIANITVDIQEITRVLLSGAFWILFWNIMITAILGIYFLADRMQHDE